VELHGGRASAANRPGHGAVFTMELPGEVGS
jgi:signal transduction histidine kinase